MWYRVVLLILVVIICILSYYITWVNYLLLAIILSSLLVLLFFSFAAIFKKPNIKIFKWGIGIIGICTIGVIVSLFTPYPDAVIQSDDISKKLKYAYTTDQSDRKELKSFIGYFSRLNERDDIRLNQVREIYSKEKKLSSMDKFHAAFVFHHSNNSDDYEVASKLASEAANDDGLKENYLVQWLNKAAHDRWMVSIGKPEKYNTQNKLSIDFK